MPRPHPHASPRFGFNCGSTYVYLGNMAAEAAAAAAAAAANTTPTVDFYASPPPPSYGPANPYGYGSLSPTPADRVALNMTLAASVSGLTALLISSVRSGTVDLCVCCNALLSGLVMSTPACGFITSWAAVVYGLVAASMYLCGSKLLVGARGCWCGLGWIVAAGGGWDGVSGLVAVSRYTLAAASCWRFAERESHW